MSDFNPIDCAKQLKEYCYKQATCHLCLLSSGSLCMVNQGFPFEWKINECEEDGNGSESEID